MIVGKKITYGIYRTDNGVFKVTKVLEHGPDGVIIEADYRDDLVQTPHQVCCMIPSQAPVIMLEDNTEILWDGIKNLWVVEKPTKSLEPSCKCDIIVLMNRGCQCGSFKEEQLK